MKHRIASTMHPDAISKCSAPCGSSPQHHHIPAWPWEGRDGDGRAAQEPGGEAQPLGYEHCKTPLAVARGMHRHPPSCGIPKPAQGCPSATTPWELGTSREPGLPVQEQRAGFRRRGSGMAAQPQTTLQHSTHLWDALWDPSESQGHNPGPGAAAQTPRGHGESHRSSGQGWGNTPTPRSSMGRTTAKPAAPEASHACAKCPVPTSAK